MMSPHSPSLVPSYVTKIELGQIGATLVLPVSLHSDKFVAPGEKLVSRMRNWSITISTSSQPGGSDPVLPSKLILVLGVVRHFFSSPANTDRKMLRVICLLCLRPRTADADFCSVQCMLCSDAESSLFLPQTFQPWKYSNLEGGYMSAQICRIVRVL